MASKTNFRFAILAALATTAFAFSGCGDDENPAPPPGAGGKGSGGKGSGGKGSGGKVNPDSGAGGDNAGGGGSGSGGKASGGSDNSGGNDNTGGVVIPPDAGCEDDGCWSCAEKAELKHFLNACTESECIPYDNSGLPSPLPALP